jgi:hypothetical protein
LQEFTYGPQPAVAQVVYIINLSLAIHQLQQVTDGFKYILPCQFPYKLPFLIAFQAGLLFSPIPGSLDRAVEDTVL